MIRIVLFPGDTVEIVTMEPHHAKVMISEKTIAVLEALKTPGRQFIKPVATYVKKARKEYKKRFKHTKLDTWSKSSPWRRKRRRKTVTTMMPRGGKLVARKVYDARKK